ncbi:MAG: NAD(P)-dependent alcohol dehydrogenase [Nitrospinota bacterium]|nr:NAD(P)-dependent alcohol dehydrogenase [Nitrospinota bacterium]
MKAIVYDEYGPPEVLRVEEVKKPTLKDNEILVKVHATAVNFGEIKIRNFKPTLCDFWLPGPLWPLSRLMIGWSEPRSKTPGGVTAGEVEAVGGLVTTFKPGDQVFGYVEGFGAAAEYVCMSEAGAVVKMPSNMSYEEAAPIPTEAMTALHFMKKASIKEGHKVLIVGASGGIGQFATQIAKSYGARVTGVCHGSKRDFVRSLGADHAIDYTTEDFTQNGETYNVIFDTFGKSSYASCKESLTENGRYLASAFGMREVGQMFMTSILGGRKVICSLAPFTKESLMDVAGLIEAGVIKTVIDRRYPLERIVEAHRYVEEGLKKGSVVITVT